MLANTSRWALPALLYTAAISALSLVRWHTRAPLSWEVAFGIVALNGTMAFALASAFELVDRMRGAVLKWRRLWSVSIAIAGVGLSWHIGAELTGAVTYFETMGYRQVLAVALAAGVLLLLVGLRADGFGNRRLGTAVLVAGLVVLVWAQDRYCPQLREARYAGVSAAFLLLTGLLALRSIERLSPPRPANGRRFRSLLLPLCGCLLLGLFTSELAVRRMYFAGLFPGRFVSALYYPRLVLRSSRLTTETARAAARVPPTYTAVPSRAPAEEGEPDELVVYALVDTARYDAFTAHAQQPSSKLHRVWSASCLVGPAYSPASDTVNTLDRLLVRPGASELWVDTLRNAGVKASVAIDHEILDQLNRRVSVGFGSHFDVVVPLQRSTKGELRFESVAAAVAKLVRNERGPHFVWAHFFQVHDWFHGLPDDAGREAYDARIVSVGDELAELATLLEATRRRATLIVTADHGEGIDHFSTRTHGQFLYEPLVRTPLMIWTNSPPCSPRVLALKDKLPIQGLALGRLVLDQFGVASDPWLPTLAQLTSGPILMHSDMQQAVIRWPHKLIVSPWFTELFDLERDPGEHHDLIDERADLAEELRGLLR